MTLIIYIACLSEESFGEKRRLLGGRESGVGGQIEPLRALEASLGN